MKKRHEGGVVVRVATPPRPGRVGRLRRVPYTLEVEVGGTCIRVRGWKWFGPLPALDLLVGGADPEHCALGYVDAPEDGDATGTPVARVLDYGFPGDKILVVEPGDELGPSEGIEVPAHALRAAGLDLDEAEETINAAIEAAIPRCRRA